MNFGTAIVLIVLIIGVCSVMMQRSRDKTWQSGNALNDQERRTLEAERDDARQELDQLKERVKVLERIATDPARRTAEEIEKLRDE